MPVTQLQPAEQIRELSPEQSRSERLIVLALFVISFFYLCLFRHFTNLEPDEGIVLQGAQRIVAGQVPYRDFFSFYTPGSYYAIALVFRVFGSSLAAARTALAFAGAILSVVTYLLARRVCSRGLALTLGALATFTTLPYRFLVLHNWDSTLWACLTIYAAVRLLEAPTCRWALASGAFASLTVLSEQSKGAGLCLGLVAGLLAIWFIEGRKRLLNRSELFVLAAGFAIPVVITFAYFAAQHATSAMLADWLWPLRHYSAANRVLYGYQNWTDASRHQLFGSGSWALRFIATLVVSPCFWIPALPPIAIGLLVYWIVRARDGSLPSATSRYYIIVTCAYLGLALSVVITRADIIHFMYLQPLNCLMLAWLLGGVELDGGMLKAARPASAAYVVIALAAFGLPPLFNATAASDRITTRRGEVSTRTHDDVIEYVQAKVPEGKTILVYPYLPLYYYLTATQSPGPYDYFQPGMHTPEQSAEIVLELATGRVDEVLFEPNFADKVAHSWPGTPLAAIASDPAVDYIAHHYRPCRDLTSAPGWHFLFMVRKELACP